MTFIRKSLARAFLLRKPRAAAGVLYGLLLAVLLALTGFALWVAVTTHDLLLAVEHSSLLSDRYEDTRYALAHAESLELDYRLQPSAEVRAEYQAAAKDLRDALGSVREVSEPGDLALVNDLVALSNDYSTSVSRLFAAMDAGDTAGAKAIDTSETDLLFEEIQRKVNTAEEDHRALALGGLDELQRTQSLVFVATPIVFAVGVGLLVLFGTVLIQYQRRERDDEHLRALVQNSADIITVIDPYGSIRYQTPAVQSVLGVSAEKMIGKPIFDLFEPDEKPGMQLFIAEARVRQGQQVTMEFRARHADGSLSYLETIGVDLSNNPYVRGLLLTCRDITDRKALESQLTRQAFHDALTGLPNRALFMDRLQQALARAERSSRLVGVLFLDLDEFKLINDSLGHKAGDQLLIRVAERLRSGVRTMDSIARLGGDEFTFLLEDLQDVMDATSIASRVIDELQAPFDLDGHEVFISPSIGIAMSSGTSKGPDELLREADLAMYEAKTNGKARFAVFNSSMNSRVRERLAVENDLRRAVEQHEFKVYYQPIVELKSGRVLELEALARWAHPTRGLLEPAEFIPVAEATGLIVRIGQWMLGQACRDMRAWQKQSAGELPLALSVNLSAKQFQQPNLVEVIARILRESELDPTCLKLEITESVALDQEETTLNTLHRLKALGVQLAIDDFGTGYSALSYLKHYPIDTVKIDRSFVSDIGQNREDIAIVNAVLSFAKTLRMNVVAEGIETPEQLSKLEELGCLQGQGYYFAKPMPSEGLESFLKEASLNPKSNSTPLVPLYSAAT